MKTKVISPKKETVDPKVGTLYTSRSKEIYSVL